MNRRSFLKNLGTSLGAMASVSAAVDGGVSLLNETLSLHSGRRRPNILFLMSDQHRFDALGCAGNPVARTPNLDALAQEGAWFSCAYSTTPTCTPARSAILTGLNPWNHGMLAYGRISSNYTQEMPGELRKAGYYLFGIGKMHWYPQKLLRGYHGLQVDESGRVESADFISDYRRWFAREAPGQNPDATGIGFNSYRAAEYALDEHLHPTEWTGQSAVEFIRNYNKEQPFMLKVSFARPHSPYDAPKRFWDLYDRDEMPAPWVGDWAGPYAPLSGGGDKIWHGDLGVDQARKSRHGYYGNVSFIDEQIGKIIRALKQRGGYDNTLILYTADHGDMLGDHHHWRKSYPYEGSTHVPMILRWPSGMKTAVSRGAVLDHPVEMRDIFPTFMEAAQTPMRQAVDGASMLRLIRESHPRWREWIDLEHDRCYSDGNKWHALVNSQCKYIFNAQSGREMLFDLQADPHEVHDLAAEAGQQAALTTWRNRLIDHLSVRGSGYVKNGQLVYPRGTRIYSPNYPG